MSFASLGMSNRVSVKHLSLSSIPFLVLPHSFHPFLLFLWTGLGSIALVLSIQFPEIGNWWYGLTLLSPLAGWYYWTNANREEEVSNSSSSLNFGIKVTVMLMTSDDEKETEIIVEGNEEELDRFSKELQLQEKGKIYVKGILEQ